MTRSPRFTPTVLVLAAALFVPAHVLADSGGKAQQGPTIEQFLKIRTPGQPFPLADGSLLVTDRPDGIVQLYRFTPKGTAGTESALNPTNVTVTRLTDFPDGLTAYAPSPSGDVAVLMHARGGDENWNLTLLDLKAAPGPAAMTTVFADPKVQAGINAWLRDGSGFIYSANAESPTDFYLYRYDIATRKTTKLLGKEGAWSARDVTQDGSRVLVQHNLSASNIECYELNVASGALTDLTIRPKDGTAGGGLVGYMPDERSVLLQSDVKGDHDHLFVRDLATGAVREPVPALGRYELDGAAANEPRDLLAVIANQDGYGALFVYSLPDFKPVRMPDVPKGVVGFSSFREHSLVWSVSNARIPGLSYVTTWPAANRAGAPRGPVAPATRQLTWAETQGIDFEQFQLPQLVTYPAFDGKKIPAFLYLPKGAAKGTPIPFVIVYHGGPEGQHRPSFTSTLQYYVSRGYGLLLPNVRGSTGYGREFQLLDNYKKRWDSVRDGVDAAEWLVKSGYATPGRIATYGASYGGFMAVACIVEDQERVERNVRPARLFGACVDVVGIVNMQTFLEKTSGYRRKLREVEYGPVDDKEFLATVSSIHKVDKIQVPVFVGHGFNDPRVPVQEAMQLATALKEKGLSPRLFIAPDEGHGFAKLDNRIYFGERMAQFLDETIGAAPARAVGSATTIR